MGDCLDVICFEQGLGASCLLVATVYVSDFEIFLVCTKCFECFCSLYTVYFSRTVVSFVLASSLSTRGNFLRPSGIHSLPFHACVFLN